MKRNWGWRLVLGLALGVASATAGTLPVFINGGRSVSTVTYGEYPYRPTTNYEYTVRITIPSLHYTNEIQRTSPVRITDGQVTNQVAARLLEYAATRGVNTNNLTIQFRRPQ